MKILKIIWNIITILSILHLAVGFVWSVVRIIQMSIELVKEIRRNP